MKMKAHLKMLRKNVLVDTGKLLGLTSDLIITPDKYKMIGSIGTIIAVAPKCRRVHQEDVGRKVLLPIVHHEDQRIRPEAAEQLGLSKTYHFIVHEDHLKSFV